MEKIKRKLIIENFVENTTFHGVFYAKTANRCVRLIWLFTVFISAAFIILSTVLMVNKYLRHESYIITEERDFDSLEDIPNLLVCSSQKLSIVDSILEYDPKMREAYETRNISELSSLVIDDIYMQKMRQRVLEANKYSLASCKISIKDQLIDCMGYKQDIVFTFNGFCFLLSFQELKENSSILRKETNLLNYFNRNDAKIEVKFSNNSFISESAENFDDDVFNSETKEELVAESDESGNTETKESEDASTSSYITVTENDDENPSNSLYTTDHEESKITVESLHFQLLPTDCFHCIFNQLNNKLIFNRYSQQSSVKYYDVISTYTEYSSSLNKRKCFDNNDEAACHFTCLQQIIAELVRCHFKFDTIEKGMPYCSLSQLATIEEIIQDYSYYRSKYSKICDTECLPNCKSLKFEVKETFGKGKIDSSGFIWNFNLQYKGNRIKYIEVFDYMDLLNFINGLWSLFLGISVLSIWEIIELIYALVSRWSYFKKAAMASSSSDIKKEPMRKLKTVVHSIFHDTHLHGLKNVFSEHSSKYVKIRWFIVILIASIGFSIALKDATLEYLEYKSNLEKSIKQIAKDDLLMNRKFAFLLCKPLILVNQSQKDFYMQLDKRAQELFTGDTSDIDKILYEYKKQMNVSNENIVDLYENTFSRKKLPFTLNVLDNSFQKANITVSPSNFYFDKICKRIQVNEILDEWFSDKIFSISHRGLSRDELNLSIYPEYELKLFIMDSESFHIADRSWYKSFSSLNENIPNIRANLKHKQLLPSPFRPSCNPTKDYRQHECYQECFNQIIFQVFQCKVIFGEAPDSTTTTNYCHPWMIPLIINYEKYILRKSFTNKCDHCKEPCDFYYYDLEKEYDSIFRISNMLTLFDNCEITQQKKILIFEDTVIIIISLFSLFFGASVLAFIQILFNMTINFCKTSGVSQKELNFLRKITILELVSNSTTIHCAKYLSSKYRNDIKKLFWLVILIITMSTGVAYCAIKIRDYQRSKSTLLNTELDVSISRESINVDICTIVNEWNLARDNPEVENLDVFRMRLHFTPLEEMNEFSSLSESFIFYLNNFTAMLASREEYQHLSEFKVSSLVNNIIDQRFESVYILNDMDWRVDRFTKLSSLNFTTTIHDTSLIYDFSGININVCKRVDWSHLQNQTFGMLNNQFLKTAQNQLSLFYGNTFQIYLEKYLLVETQDTIVFCSILKRIKSFYKNYDYKHSCKSRDNCVSRDKVLDEYSEHKLFLCNNELRDTVYSIFNCTPFMTHTKHMTECSITYTLLIFKIMEQFKNALNKCEFSSVKYPIEIEEFLISEYSIERNSSLDEDLKYQGIDLNSVKIYTQKMIQEYDLLQLVIDISNWLNVLIGFSFITMCELVFIFFYKKNSTSKIDNIQQ